MTIRELARLAGVSPATVSRVFSHHPGICEELRSRVLDLARKHHYTPPVRDKQRNVVVITPYESAFPAQSCVDMLLMALMQALPPRGFRIEILPLNNLERLDSIQFCAAAAIGVDPQDLEGWSERFAVPLIVVDRELKHPSANVCTVRSDEAGGMAMAIECLKRHRCRKIGCLVHGDPGTGNADIRAEACRKELKKHAFPCDDRLVQFTGPGPERYVELIGKMLKLGCDALFCPGGTGGIAAVYALSLYDRKIPDEISVIATEQTFFSRYAVPPQTTVTQNYPAVASAVGDLIESWLKHRRIESPPPLPYILLERESVQSSH